MLAMLVSTAKTRRIKGDRLQRAGMRKSTVRCFRYSALLYFLICLIIGCRNPRQERAGSQKEDSRIMIIEVSCYKNPYDSKDLEEVYVGKVRVASDGKLAIIDAVKGPLGERLRKAIDEISSLEVLEGEAENWEEIDGERVLVMYSLEVRPGDESYPHTVEDYLVAKYGFLTRMYPE